LPSSGRGAWVSFMPGFLASARAVSELVVAVADFDQAKVVAEGLGAEAVQDPMEALESADAAVIATPAETHAVLVKAAVGRGCPVLCEKPLAESLDAAIELTDYVNQARVLVKMGFQRRFDYGYRAARSAVIEGRLGRLYLMRLQVTEPGRPPSPKTNLLRNTAIHDFDLVRWLSGEEVLSVYVDGADRNRRVFDPRFDPDTVVASLRLTGGRLQPLPSLGCHHLVTTCAPNSWVVAITWQWDGASEHQCDPSSVSPGPSAASAGAHGKRGSRKPTAAR
jgi:myo-inositol 2-dehydrogenase / D-chiro-inositol 1-dehydrogenase